MKQNPYDIELWKIILLCFVMGAGAMTVSYFLPKNNTCTPSQDTLSINQQLSDISQDINRLDYCPKYLNQEAVYDELMELQCEDYYK